MRSTIRYVMWCLSSGAGGVFACLQVSGSSRVGSVLFAALEAPQGVILALLWASSLLLARVSAYMALLVPGLLTWLLFWVGEFLSTRGV